MACELTATLVSGWYWIDVILYGYVVEVGG